MNISIILAGGTGVRLGGDIPKQYIEVKGRKMIAYCLDKFANNPSVNAIQIVASKEWHNTIKQCMDENWPVGKWKGFSEPGKNRQMSILNALEDTLKYASPEDYVMIHDAARPLVRPDFITSCFEYAKGHGGVVPSLPMKDTVYLSEESGRITSLLKRETVFAGQAPEVFRLGEYYAANRALLPDRILSINGSAEPAVMAEMDIVMMDGDEGNFKITTNEDLIRFKQIIALQTEERR